jgi:hypothetical protein
MAATKCGFADDRSRGGEEWGKNVGAGDDSTKGRRRVHTALRAGSGDVCWRRSAGSGNVGGTGGRRVQKGAASLGQTDRACRAV